MTAHAHATLRASLALSAGFTMIALRLYRPGFEHHGAWLAGVAYDLCAVALVWVLGRFLAGGKGRRRDLVATPLTYVALLFMLCLVHAHSTFFWAAIERRLAAFIITLPGVYEFYTESLPGEERLPSLAFLLGFHTLAAALFFSLRNRPRVLLGIGRVASLLVLSAGILVISRQRVTSPLYDTFDEARLVMTAPHLTPAAKAPPELVAALDGSKVVPSAPLAFDRIVVLVMETMTERKLAEETPALPPDTFFRAQREHSHRYSQYLSVNQDSRTGMLAMLAGRVIPYEAYSDAGLAGYEKIARVPSLLAPLAERGFQSAFAVSQMALEEVVTDLPWDARIHLSEADIEAAKKAGKVCLTPDIWERGCEDLVLLPKVLSFLRGSPKAFVYQEFIWGHAHEYNDETGKTNTFYYSAYVDALIEALRTEGMLARTLIVVTSDHGFRDKSLQTERWVYDIPLWFYAERFTPRAHRGLYSHADFRRLLFAEASESPAPAASPLAMTVGPTGTGIVSAFTPQGDMIVTRRVGPYELQLARIGTTLAPETMLAVRNAHQRAFDAAVR